MDYHQPMAHLFYKDIGQKLTLLESEVLLRLMDKGVVALPVHDCIIIGEENKELGYQVMMETFEELVGVEASVSTQ